jgi:hypothetical protein
MMTTMAALLAAAAGARHRHRLGAAPAAGHRDGRRPAAQPGADALHHAGHLHLLRQSGAALRAAAGGAAPSRSRGPQPGGARMNISRPSSPAGRHHAAHGRDRAGRRDRFQGAAGLAAAAGGFSHHLGGASLPGGSADIMASRSPRRWSGSSATSPASRDDLGQFAGHTSITMQFDLSRDIDGAARDVEAAINAARTYLPANLPANPTYRKVNPADSPIMILGLSRTITVRTSSTTKPRPSSSRSSRRSRASGRSTWAAARCPRCAWTSIPTQLASYGLTWRTCSRC